MRHGSFSLDASRAICGGDESSPWKEQAFEPSGGTRFPQEQKSRPAGGANCAQATGLKALSPVAWISADL